MTNETVLVVDDDAQVRSFVVNTFLEPHGYDVLVATNGRDGLKLFLEEGPDLALLDLHLPHLSGLDILRKMREEGVCVPAIVISAYGSEDSILEAFRLGAKDFLQKPFTLEQVNAAVENALIEERLRKEKEALTQSLKIANVRLQRQLHNWVALHDIAQAITAALEEPEVFKRVMESVNQVLDVEAGSLLLLDPEVGELRFVVTLTRDAVQFSDFRLELGEGISGWVAKHGKSLLVPDVRQDPRFCPRIDRALGFQSRSILCVPLLAQERVIGVLEVINKRGGPRSPSFTPGDEQLLTMLASWVSVAVENARLNRAKREMVATTVLGQTVAAVAHHINNRLMALSLEIDQFADQDRLDRRQVGALISTTRRCIQQISAVVKAMDRLDGVQTVPYVGSEEMLDIEEQIEEQLRLIGANAGS